MQKDKVENLGFTQVNSYENEIDKKREMFRKLVEIDKMAERNIIRMRGKEPHDNNLYNV